ncbi:MAG: sigma-70 family RNA polymerase sigma factor [Deltaproteobacteria bacterium]|nr:sigma-70 family RNA polymerase sigma factor [Deltaproteobacteria bacterium]
MDHQHTDLPGNEDSGKDGQDNELQTEEPGDVTTVLMDWSEGDSEPLVALMPKVCDELRSIARRCMHGERNITLQPTALVNEFFLKLNGRRSLTWKNSGQFFGFASDCMAKILIDHARTRKRIKRGRDVILVPLDEEFEAVFEDRGELILAINDALAKLEKLDARLAKIVRLRFFVGLNVEETGAVLKISKPTVVRDWRTAKAFLRQELGNQTETPTDLPPPKVASPPTKPLFP